MFGRSIFTVAISAFESRYIGICPDSSNDISAMLPMSAGLIRHYVTPCSSDFSRSGETPLKVIHFDQHGVTTSMNAGEVAPIA